MPRAFTPDESALISERLRAAGRELFARKGIRGTTVDDLARAAAISKGAFYRFFDSKETLLLTLLDEHEIETHARIEAAIRADPARGVDLLVDSALYAIHDNPLIPVLMSEEGIRVIRSQSPERQQAMVDRDDRLVERVLAVLQEAGTTLDVPTGVLVGLLRSLVFTGQHYADIGPELVDELGDWLKQCLRAGLRPARQRDGVADPGGPTGPTTGRSEGHDNASH